MTAVVTATTKILTSLTINTPQAEEFAMALAIAPSPTGTIISDSPKACRNIQDGAEPIPQTSIQPQYQHCVDRPMPLCSEAISSLPKPLANSQPGPSSRVYNDSTPTGHLSGHHQALRARQPYVPPRPNSTYAPPMFYCG